MNMISQLPQVARFEAVGERRLPVQVPIATYDHDPQTHMLEMEARMLEAMRNSTRKHVQLPPPANSAAQDPLACDTTRAAYDMLASQRTVSEIADALGLSRNQGYYIFDKLQRHGLVKNIGFSRHVRQGHHITENLWVKA